MYMHGPFHTLTTKYTFFSNVYARVTRRDNMLDHKTSPNGFYKSTQRNFLQPNRMKLEINRKRKTRNFTNT